MCVCVCACVRVCVCESILCDYVYYIRILFNSALYVCVQVYVYTYVCTCIRMYVCTAYVSYSIVPCTYLYRCTGVCMCVCTCIRMCFVLYLFRVMFSLMHHHFKRQTLLSAVDFLHELIEKTCTLIWIIPQNH